MLGEISPCDQNARLERLVDQSEAMLGRNQHEGQAKQPVAIGRVDSIEADVGSPGQQLLKERQVILADEAEALEHLVPRRQAAEQLDHAFGHLAAHREQVRGQPGLDEHLAHIRVAREIPGVEGGPNWCAEQKVLRYRGVPDVALRIEALDQVPNAGFAQILQHRLSRPDQTIGQVRPVVEVDRASEPELENGFFEFDRCEDFVDAQFHLCGIRCVGGLVIDPVRVDVQQAVTRALRLVQPELALAELAIRVDPLANRVVFQGVDEVFPHGHRKQIRRRTHVASDPSGHRFRCVDQIDTADSERASGGEHEPRQQLRQFRTPACMVAEDCHTLVQRQLERHSVQHRGAGVIRQGDVGRHDAAMTGQFRCRDHPLHFGRCDVLDRELLDHLGVLDCHVEPLLVPVDQLLHRVWQVLVCGNDRYQRTDVETPHDDQVPADRIEQEWRHLRQKVVDELGEELALIVFESGPKQDAEPRRHCRAFVIGCVVGVDFDDAINALADAARKMTRLQLALSGQYDQPAAHARDEDGLHGNHDDSDHAQQHMLIQDEDDRGECLAAQEHR